MKPSEELRLVKKHISVRGAWAQHAAARLRDGSSAGILDPGVTARCLGSWCHYVNPDWTATTRPYLLAEIGNRGVVTFNDWHARDKRYVMRLLDRAIARAEAEGQ